LLNVCDAQRRQSAARRAQIAFALQQARVDKEVRATRLALLREARKRAGEATAVLFDTEFLALADEPAVFHAILQAALYSAAADSCDLQLLDRQDGRLRIRAQHGFTDSFLTAFDAVTTKDPTACAVALAIRKPVLVHDIISSPIFTGQPTLPPMLEAGTRAVASYPLFDGDPQVIGVLSFHYRRPSFERGNLDLVALGAATALVHTDGHAPDHGLRPA
jgi:GAF domain-containing protein